MITCTSCHKELDDGTLVCPGCGSRVAVHAKKAKLESLKLNTKNITTSAFGSVLFLIISIAMSVITLGSVISVFRNFGANTFANVANLIDLALLVFPVLGTVGCWMAYASAKSNFNVKSIGYIKIFPKYLHVIGTIGIVLVSIGVALVFILLITVVALGNDFYNQVIAAAEGMEIDTAMLEALGGSLLTIVGILMVAIILVLIVVILYVRCFKKIHAHFGLLNDSINAGTYGVNVKTPYISLFIFGGLYAIGGLVSFASDFGSGIASLAYATYMIVLALFFKQINDQQRENALLVDAASAELDDAIRATEVQIAMEDRNRRVADDEAIHKMQEQNQLFQQMLLNNMMNNKDANVAQMQEMMSNMMAQQSASGDAASKQADEE